MNREYGSQVDVTRLITATSADGSLDQLPIFLDLRLGNTCSLACIMCAFPVSSRWGSGRRPAWTTANIDPYRHDRGFWQTLEAIAHHLRYLYLAGGEPFQQPDHTRLLDLLISAGVADQISIRYNSNLMTLPSGASLPRVTARERSSNASASAAAGTPLCATSDTPRSMSRCCSTCHRSATASATCAI